MNRNSIPTLVGVLVSLFVIWILHEVLIVKDCLENEGSFQYNSGKCLLESGQIYQSNLETMALFLYFFVGFIVSLLVSRLIKKIFKINK